MKGRRELAFFVGKAVGPVYAGFCYESEAGAHASPIAFRPPPDKTHHGSATTAALERGERSQGTCTQMDVHSENAPIPHMSMLGPS